MVGVVQRVAQGLVLAGLLVAAACSSGNQTDGTSTAVPAAAPPTAAAPTAAAPTAPSFTVATFPAVAATEPSIAPMPEHRAGRRRRPSRRPSRRCRRSGVGRRRTGSPLPRLRRPDGRARTPSIRPRTSLSGAALRSSRRSTASLLSHDGSMPTTLLSTTQPLAVESRSPSSVMTVSATTWLTSSGSRTTSSPEPRLTAVIHWARWARPAAPRRVMSTSGSRHRA